VRQALKLSFSLSLLSEATFAFYFFQTDLIFVACIVSYETGTSLTRRF